MRGEGAAEATIKYLQELERVQSAYLREWRRFELLRQALMHNANVNSLNLLGPEPPRRPDWT